MNLFLSFLDLIIYDILSIIWKRPLWNVVSKFFGETFWLSFLFNVLLEDLNGFIFVRFDVYYYEWITNYRTIVAIIFSEVLGAFIVGMTNWQAAHLTNDYCYPYFTSESLYISSLPYLLCFITSGSVVVYMIYKRYELSNMEAPQHNITYPQVVPASQHQGQDTSSKITTSRGNSQHATRQLVPQTSRIAWLDPSVPSTSAYVQHQSQNIDEDVQEQVGWQDPSLWLQSSCFPPAVQNFLEKSKKYLKANIYSLVLISFLLPPNVIIIIIKFWDLKCEYWGSFAKTFDFFNLIFVLPYPYVVKLKLDKFC